MMADRPDGAELLEIAREALRTDILDDLPKEHRFVALMVANAMAIAARELRAGDAPLRAALADLATLYNKADEPETNAAALEVLTQRLARDIRAGRFDTGPDATRVHAVLLAATRRRLELSNPKYLAESDAA